MTTSTRRRQLDPAKLVEWQHTPDDSGAFPSYEDLRKRLAAQGVVTKGAIQKAVVKYRTDHALPPAPRAGTTLLPFRLPAEFHHDAIGFPLHRVARRGLDPDVVLRDDELAKVAAFYRRLQSQGPNTVVRFDEDSPGWVIRPRTAGEEIWYGVVAVHPYPPAKV